MIHGRVLAREPMTTVILNAHLVSTRKKKETITRDFVHSVENLSVIMMLLS